MMIYNMETKIVSGIPIIARYIHGSEDSTDLDVVYITDILPEFQKCKSFCDKNPDGENRNLAVITDGAISSCYKGSPDELNNSLLETYSLHEQTDELLVTHKVPRIKPVKYARAIRIILSHLSRSKYRSEIKAALRGFWTERLNTLNSIYLPSIDFSELKRTGSPADIKKIIAFQIAQVIGLLSDLEFYTKSKMSETYPVLKQFLYREEDSDINQLDNYLKWMATLLFELDTEDLPGNKVLFKAENMIIDLKNESIVENE